MDYYFNAIIKGDFDDIVDPKVQWTNRSKR